MASLFDIFKRTSTLDPNKDYAFTIAENATNDISVETKKKINEIYGINLDDLGGKNERISEKDNGNNRSTSGDNNSTDSSRDISGNSTIESEKIKQMEDEIASLKKVNRQLANNTVVSSPDTVEDMIYNLCVGKEIKNGSWQTTSSEITE